MSCIRDEMVSSSDGSEGVFRVFVSIRCKEYSDALEAGVAEGSAWGKAATATTAVGNISSCSASSLRLLGEGAKNCVKDACTGPVGLGAGLTFFAFFTFRGVLGAECAGSVSETAAGANGLRTSSSLDPSQRRGMEEDGKS
jgi:hypothetical protein